ncbi:glycoside hydrolase family 20 protein [Trematosphaeria pertusa]|uniref:beta-N-acetylhexosaminidase n=1 Tax=Trematosphaeria pertusa TaxID=390896 RepID=A0A6A6IXE5_9PLEO|nr:glycoside hydrolase family 20 protein [Trematosphaeria pertusa]KAF2255211.1 glycoside hydrolase family 20 protein [Trematosphaeria pertusa]
MLSVLQLSVSLLLTAVHGRSLGIPTLPFSSGGGQLRLSDIQTVIVDANYADSVDNRGDTLIPPSLTDFSETFVQDMKTLGVELALEDAGESRPGSIFLTLGDPTDYLDAAGRESSEGYTISVASSNITIAGSSSLGVWWGTRTILQQAILNNGSIPRGTVTDTPGWGTRGMMLDAARHYYPPGFLVEMCAYMSFFKQNTFHLHLSDNLYNNVDIYNRERSLELYARFRLWSDAEEVAGLNKHKNESYTRKQFDHIQSACAARGVTVVPEIEAPGHALVLVQWKPELGFEDDLSLLNISNPDTIPTMKSVWSVFLPWFHSKTVHIGADEYTAGANDYNAFVNAMADHIHTASNKSVRIWGTFPPNYTQPDYINIYPNVSVQHWEFFEDNPLYDYILNNYTVLNSDDTFYVVNKWSGSYPQKVNVSATFIGNPNTGGSLWYPYVFDTKNSSNNPLRDESLVLGEIAALWNDYGPNSSVYSEAYYAWREGIPALADKQWGGNLTQSEFPNVLQTLLPFIPGQDLERRIPSKTSTILEYTFGRDTASQRSISDSSGNVYDGYTDCSTTGSGSIAIGSCSVTTPLSSKGRNYTLTLSFQISSLEAPTNATLIAGGDSALMLTPNTTFFAGGNYYRLNSSLPLDRRLHLDIIGRGNHTFAKVNDGREEEFLTQIGVNGERFEWGPMAFEAPLHQIGGEGAGWTGQLYGLKLSSLA